MFGLRRGLWTINNHTFWSSQVASYPPRDHFRSQKWFLKWNLQRGVLEPNFCFQLFRFWVLKWVLKWYFPLLKNMFKKNKKSLLKPSHFRKKRWGNLRPQKKYINMRRIKKTLQRALHDTPQHFSVDGGHRWSCHFLPTEPGFCPQSFRPFLPNH